MNEKQSKFFGIVAVAYAAAQPVIPGLANGLAFLWLMGWGWGLVAKRWRGDRVALAVAGLFAALFIAVACNPDIVWIVRERLAGVSSEILDGDPRSGMAGREFWAIWDYWHFLLLMTGGIWLSLGWPWLRRALLAFGISSSIALLSSYVELFTKINFRWDLFGPMMKRADLLWLIGRDTVTRLPEGRVMGFFDHPLTYGGLLGLTALLSAGFFLYGSFTGEDGTSRGLRRGLAPFTLLTGLMLVLAKNRSYWFGAGPAAAVLLWWKGRRWLLGLGVAGLAIFALAYSLSSDFRFRFNDIFVMGHNNERFVFWCSGKGMVQDRPLTGWGPRGYREHGQLYRDECRKGFELSNFTHVHNSYLQVAVEGGLIGEAAFLFLLALIALRLYRRAKAGDNSAAFARGMLAALVCYSVAALFEWNFGDKEPSMPLFFFLAAALNVPAEESLPKKESE